MLNGIDVSSWQKGINLYNVPGDFVIVKATQGRRYFSPTFYDQYNAGKQAGKLMGIYHYASGGGATAEADFFLSKVSKYVGEAVLVLDWESGENPAYPAPAYAKAFLDRVFERTGVRPLIYMSRSVAVCYDWSAVAPNYGLWLAQYANNVATGYQTSPWSQKPYGAWGSACAIHQYSSNGRLPGYSGPLDINLAYMTADAWHKYANPNYNDDGTIIYEPSKETVTVPDGSTLDLVHGVMLGKYGNGEARKTALGSKYADVQKMIDHIAKADVLELVIETRENKYGTGETRKAVLGSRYKEVQDMINHVSTATATTLAREVKNGKYGNGDTRRKVLGSRYDQVQTIVNIFK